MFLARAAVTARRARIPGIGAGNRAFTLHICRCGIDRVDSARFRIARGVSSLAIWPGIAGVDARISHVLARAELLQARAECFTNSTAHLTALRSGVRTVETCVVLGEAG